jgi:hypothetical protein
MIWAVLVAVGVAVVSMTLFGARITRRPSPEDRIVADLEVTDPDDPWAAWKPRPIDVIDEVRRPRLWPVGAALTGLLMVGAGFAGARQTLWTSAAADASDHELTTPEPYIVQVEIPPTPTPKPTPKPTPVRTAAPSTNASAAAASGTAPTLSGSASCSGGALSLSFTATAQGSRLSWYAVYVDGSVKKGGPLNGASYTGSYQGPGTPGDHALEVAVEDDAKRTSRKQFQVRCA